MDPRRLLIFTTMMGACGCAALPATEPLAVTAAEWEALALQLPRPATPAPDPLGLPPRQPSRAESLMASPGPAAIAAANQSARAASQADAFVGGVQVFDWAPGRIYEVWTAPLRVTALVLQPGETVIAKAAGDTLRWRVAETTAGQGAASRVHLLIKPLEAGLETNFLLTTDQRTYLIRLLSGAPESYNAAVAWRLETAPEPDPILQPEALHGRYDIRFQGARPAWTPRAVLDDGRRTFIFLDPDVAAGEAPALFVGTGRRAELANYRQVGSVLVLDRLFTSAELRRGGRNPEAVQILRRAEGVR
jgi:type IV secretion system protein TrbG